MNVSGTLHLYSGVDRELFFVFDDDVAQQLSAMGDFHRDDPRSRRAYISVGSERFIHARTLHFTRKQTEIKISLCSRNTKDNLGALTALYDWFAPNVAQHPEPVEVLASLNRRRHRGAQVWELHFLEPANLELVPPAGALSRPKLPSQARQGWLSRRKFQERDLQRAGRKAEILALDVAQRDYPPPEYRCLWRDGFLDSEIPSVRSQAIIADVDVWCDSENKVAAFLEVKAQKVVGAHDAPIFFLSRAEFRSYESARNLRLPYFIWLFQYRDLKDFDNAPNLVSLIVFESLRESWLNAEQYLVRPEPGFGARRRIPRR